MGNKEYLRKRNVMDGVNKIIEENGFKICDENIDFDYSGKVFFRIIFK